MRKKKEDKEIFSKKYQSKTKKSKISILTKHDKYLEFLLTRNKRLNEIEGKIKLVNTKILNLQKRNTNGDLSNDVEILRSNLENYKNTKQEIEKEMDMNEYLLNTSSILSEYEELEKRELILYENSDENIDELNIIFKRKMELTDEYLKIVDPEHVKAIEINYNKCPNCNLYIRDKVCIECGYCDDSVQYGNDLSYKELQDYEYKSQFTYHKESHLMDWIRRFTAQENITIPQEIIDQVLLEAKKERITDVTLITQERVKKYLKKLGHSKYFDNIINIVNRIQGRPRFNLSTEIQNKLVSMFNQIQEPFRKFKGSERKNFLSYSYVLHKFFLILDLPEFAKYFFLLKSNDKLRQQDEVFKKIVTYMAQHDKSVNWRFFPSV